MKFLNTTINPVFPVIEPAVSVTVVAAAINSTGSVGFHPSVLLQWVYGSKKVINTLQMNLEK